MSKTLDALDAMGERLITQVWGYVTSGKFLAYAATVALAIKQGGLEGLYVVLGATTVFTGEKAYQNVKMAQIKANAEVAKANGQATLPKPTVPQSGASQVTPDVGEQQEYAEPFDPTLYRADAKSAFLRWEQFEDAYTRVDFNNFAPAVRYRFAHQLVREGWIRLEAAWTEAFQNAGASEAPLMPMRTDFQPGSMRLTEEAEQRLGKLLPATCGRLSTKVYNIGMLTIATWQWYRMFDNLIQLEGLDIDWAKAPNLEAIERRGLGVVSNKPHLVVNSIGR